jgi:hypothetical protein
LIDDVFAPWNQPDVSTDPADYPGLLWTPPLIVELVKIPKPDPTPGKIAEPVLVWTETSCTRDWEIRDMTPTELADSLRKVWPNTQAFLAEFTVTEMAGIGLSVDPTVAALRLMLSVWSGQIYSDDERVVAGLSALLGAGIITAERRAQIAPSPEPAPEPAPASSGALSADTATIDESAGVMTFGGGLTPVLHQPTL